MKAKLFFLVFFICCAVFTVALADNSSNVGLANVSEYDKKEQVLLAGTLETGMIKSLSIIPFDVWKSSMSIDISYLSNLSNIDVEIENESGQSFYHSNVNPMAGGQLLINIDGWAEGTYTIIFTNDNGGSVYGSFTI